VRILYVVPAYKPAYRFGGPVVTTSALAEGLVKQGHHVTVLSTNSNLDEDLDVPLGCPIDVEGVEVHYFARTEPVRRWLPFVSYLSRSVGVLYSAPMREALQRLAPAADLVHAHLPFVYPTYAAAQAARRHHKPLFYHQHGVLDPDHLRFRGLKKRLYIAAVERRILRSATTLLALTTDEVESYRALGVTTPCRVVPNGVHTERHRTEMHGTSALVRGIPADAQVVLFLGRVHPTKGADKLLDGFLRIRDRFPRAMLVMAGPDEWGLAQRFRTQVSQAGANDRVLFPGMVTGEDKMELLARADIFCLPSGAEGFPIAALEALASATPVILSPACHFPEVEQAGAGRIVEPTPTSLAEALTDFLSRPNDLRPMGVRGRVLVERDYSWDRITHLMVDAYREGLDRYRRNGV
jgi:glycosyltransferase involved in cell wall biosynthesis